MDKRVLPQALPVEQMAEQYLRVDSTLTKTDAMAKATADLAPDATPLGGDGGSEVHPRTNVGQSCLKWYRGGSSYDDWASYAKGWTCGQALLQQASTTGQWWVGMYMESQGLAGGRGTLAMVRKVSLVQVFTIHTPGNQLWDFSPASSRTFNGNGSCTSYTLGLDVSPVPRDIRRHPDQDHRHV